MKMISCSTEPLLFKFAPASLAPLERSHNGATAPHRWTSGQWGSKRNGPDLARVGGKYSDEWHRQHLTDPRSMGPESTMPPYAFLADKDLDYQDMTERLAAQQKVGVPYTNDQVAHAIDDLEAQADPFDARGTALKKRYGARIVQRDFDGHPDRVTDMDALIAYLQMVGTFSTAFSNAER
ncbi:MAG TPA: cbb3-type cytochrome c oxidase subunit II [Phenylobacterium sp.]|jgi:cytochrome c oxidase cbb3-type subunit 2|nr:cbb3-type cytochrome c oxidase subunit II [Phenylobacterium sp.]